MNEAARPKLPPRGFIRGVWIAHRAVHRLTGGRWGLWPTRAGKWGVLRLTTIGRRSGRERVAILGYIEDGRNLVTLAMNGWADPEPAWWLNLQARPEATIRLADGTRAVRARAAVGEERERLWDRFRAQREWGAGVDGFASLRSRATAVVVFEPVHA
jgi:deazaflavin-dependent oxidoreductase (nitroreductase family)